MQKIGKIAPESEKARKNVAPGGKKGGNGRRASEKLGDFCRFRGGEGRGADKMTWGRLEMP